MTDLPARSFQSASLNSGGSAYDRQIPQDDHNPLTGLLDFDNTRSILQDAADAAAKQFQDNLIALIKALTGIDLSDSQELFDSIGHQINDAIQTMLDQWQVGWDDILGQLPSWKLGPIPIGALVADMLNRLIDGSFSTDSIASPTGRWVVDNTVYRDQPGSARVTADGTSTAIRSNRDRVFTGQKLDVRAHVAAVGLTGSGSLIELSIIPYAGDDPGAPVLLKSFSLGGSPNAQPWAAPPPGTVALYDLEAHWTVPDGVDYAATRLEVTENATAGILWWDEAFQAPDGLSLQTWLDGIDADLATVWGSFVKTDTDFGNVFTTAGDFLAALLGGEAPAVIQHRWDAVMAALQLLGEDFSTDLNSMTDTFVNAFMLGGTNNNGLTALTEDTRKSINFMLGQLGWGYLNTSWQWVSGTPGADDLPAGGFTSQGAAPPSWLADILKAVGIPVTGGDLPSQLDPTIPAAPVLFWPVAEVSTTTTVPQSTNLYYVITAVKDGKESAASNEALIYISPAWLVPKARVRLSWPALPAGTTVNVYRRTSPTGGRRQIATGVTGTTFTDTGDANTGTVREPGTAASAAAGAINAGFTVTNGNHQKLVDTIVATANDDLTLTDPNDASTLEPGTTGKTPADVAGALSNWPAEHVSGPEAVGMSADLTMSQTLDQLVGGLTSTEVSGSTPSDAGAAANALIQRLNFAGTLATVALQQNYALRGWNDGGDYTADTTLPLAMCTQVLRFKGGIASGTLLVPFVGGPKNYIQLRFAQRVTGLTNLIANLYRLAPDGKFHLLYTSGNLVSSIQSSGGTTDINTLAPFITWTLPETLQTAPGNAFYVELVNQSASTVNVSVLGSLLFNEGVQVHVGPNYSRPDAASNPSPSVLDFSGTGYGFVEQMFYAAMGYTSGAQSSINQSDIVTAFLTPGTSTWTPPDWWRPGIDFMDVVTLGGGGSGGVGSFGAGRAGSVSRVTIPKASIGASADAVITGAAGAAGAVNNTSASGSTGRSPGRKSFNGHLYVGGDPASVGLGFPTPGKAPGGGSSGAYFSGAYGHGGGAGGWDSGTFQPNVTSLPVTVGSGGVGVDTGIWKSLNGGSGAVWITARQNRSA